MSSMIQGVFVMLKDCRWIVEVLNERLQISFWAELHNFEEYQHTLIDVLSYEVTDVKGAATLFLVLKLAGKAFVGLIGQRLLN